MANPQISQACIEIMHEQEWLYKEIQNNEVFETAFKAEHANIRLHLQIFPAIDVLNVVAYHPLSCPPTHFVSIAELLLRRNLGITVGGFEFDFDHRVTLFRIYQFFSKNNPPDKEIILSIIQTAVTETDQISPILTQLFDTNPQDLDRLPISALASSI